MLGIRKVHAHPFDDLPRTPAAHFKLYFFATVAHIVQQLVLTTGSLDEACARFPFLLGYMDEVAARVPDGLSAQAAAEWWHNAIISWEQDANVHLPLRAIRTSYGLDQQALTLLICVGLIEEDSRFGLMFDECQGTVAQRRPSVGLLSAWWRDADSCDEVRTRIRRLHELGLVQFLNLDAPRIDWSLQAPAQLWEVLRGELGQQITKRISCFAVHTLPALDELVINAELHAKLNGLLALLGSGQLRSLTVRGLRRNGRKTILRALAKALGRGTLEVELATPDEQTLRLIGPIATALHAMPVLCLDQAPGESADLTELTGLSFTLGIVLGKQGGVVGAVAESALTIELAMPDVAARRNLWQRSIGCVPETESTRALAASNELDAISERFRMTSGNIQRAARLALSHAALAGRTDVQLADVQQGSRALNHQALDALATRVEVNGNWSHLAVAEQCQHELQQLVSRCRQRERLQASTGEVLGANLNAGVRALFTGASGTGKTLAARLLAAALQKDLYRLDLSMVVNKYIGETEKSLAKIFSLAEELDVILLLDEGDALLTQRTDVSSSNDRYANLETNFLLQRLECFEGILVVTTNASERIDSAFKRRMDVVVGFQAPAAFERWSILQMHLPTQHEVQPNLLDEIAQRCELSGGQLRNAVLCAASLALDDADARGLINAEHLESAVRREYRKAGAVCPLRSYEAAAAAERW